MFEDNFDIFNNNTVARNENKKDHESQKEPIDETLKTPEQLNVMKRIVFEEIKKKHEKQYERTQLKNYAVKKNVSNPA